MHLYTRSQKRSCLALREYCEPFAIQCVSTAFDSLFVILQLLQELAGISEERAISPCEGGSGCAAT